jgi:hypothetical protein
MSKPVLKIMENNAYWNGDMARGRQLSAQALALAEELENKFFLSEVLDNSLSYASNLQDELQIADRSLSLRRSFGDVDGIYRNPWEIRNHLAALAVVKVSCQGEEELAARLQGTIDAMRPDTSIVDYSTSMLYFPFHPQMVLAAPQNALGEVRYAAAYAEGQSMTLEQAAALVSE